MSVQTNFGQSAGDGSWGLNSTKASAAPTPDEWPPPPPDKRPPPPDKRTSQLSAANRDEQWGKSAQGDWASFH